jgi:anti-sigma factor RsiW
MIACGKHRGNFSALIDEQLDFNTKFEAQQHLNDCPECSEKLIQLRDMQALVEKSLLEGVDTPPDIWQLLQEKMPKVCDLIREEYSAYIDSEISVAAQDGIKSHIDSCPTCRVDFEQLSKANKTVSKFLKEPLDVKVDLWNSIKSQLNASCALITAELSPFIDQEVPNPRHRSVAAHMLTCQNCHSSFQNLAVLGDYLKENYVPDLPEDFDLLPQLATKLRVMPLPADQPLIRNKRPYILGAAAAAALIGLIGLSFLLFSVLWREKPPMVTSEDYIIQYCLAEPPEKLEANIYDVTN